MDQKQITLSEALLLRKEFQGKIDRLRNIDPNMLVAKIDRRVTVNESVDNVMATVPRVSANQVTHVYDWYAKRLRQIDGIIQRANHTHMVEVPTTVMETFLDPYVEDENAKVEAAK